MNNLMPVASVSEARVTETAFSPILGDGVLYPAFCRNEGLTCGACTSNAARHLASVCRGLNNRGLNAMFTQIYTNPACAPMASHFRQAYHQVLGTPVEV